jgi:hypothetical protein
LLVMRCPATRVGLRQGRFVQLFLGLLFHHVGQIPSWLRCE